jgi:hypothetical protein
MKVCMSDIATQIIASSNVISAPVGESNTVAPMPVSQMTEVTPKAPIAAGVLGVGVFFNDYSGEICSPEVLSDIRSKVESISNYARDNITVHSESSVEGFLNKIISENGWEKLGPTEKLEKFYNYVDLQTRLRESKNLKNIIKQLKESIYA